MCSLQAVFYFSVHYISPVVLEIDFCAHIVRLAAKYTPPLVAASPASPPIVAPVTIPISRVSVIDSSDVEVIGTAVVLAIAVDRKEFLRLDNVVTVIGVLSSVLASAEVTRILVSISVVSAGIEFEFAFITEVLRLDTGTRTGVEAVVELIALSIAVTERKITELVTVKYMHK